ncbi:MAG: aminotransferase class V-fold PLP-dependent enzyme [Acidobacteriota bacterium]|jgi:cystathionine beta-lyase
MTRFATKLLRFRAAPGDPHAPVSTPLYQTATFEQPGADELGPYDYSRSGNPTRTVLEELLAELEGGARAFAFASGMAAVSAVVRLVEAGCAVVAGDDLYGGSYRLLSGAAERHGIEVRWVDTTDPQAVADALDEHVRLVLLETPSNPLLKVTDVELIGSLARARGALLAVDNSIMSPYLQRPLELGADIVIESATKALSGHADLTAGVVAVKSDELAERIYWTQNAEGSALGPFESWLLLRSVKTLSVRLDRQLANARLVAEHLRGRQEVEAVYWPGFDDHPGAELHRRQGGGGSVVLSFETRDEAVGSHIVDATRLFTIAVSFGSVGSVISLPCRISHAAIPPEVRATRALPEGLVRVSVGLEDVDDLIRDLDAAFATARERCRLATG